jgi:penicillin amidase
MRKLIYFLSLILLLNCTDSTFKEEKRSVEGLKENVEILRDQWGINHLYAQNQHDFSVSH